MVTGENWLVRKRTGEIYQIVKIEVGEGKTVDHWERRKNLPIQAVTVREDKQWWYMVIPPPGSQKKDSPKKVAIPPPEFLPPEFRRKTSSGEAVVRFQPMNKKVTLTTGAPPIPRTPGKRRRGGRRSG
jgi:hypothetical protein